MSESRQPFRCGTAPIERVYLDVAAATPVHPSVLAAMFPYFSDQYGNPSAIHREGQLAQQAVQTARTQVARCLQVRPELVTFTSGGTESNNLAIFGYIQSLLAAGRSPSSIHVLSTAIEHPATTMALAKAAEWGVEVENIAVSETGLIDVTDALNRVRPDTVLVTLAHVNSEIGTIQPIAKLARQLRLQARRNGQTAPILHVDAAQSPLWLSVQLPKLGADLLSLDAGKFCGPKGCGILAAARKQPVNHGVLYGGGQEHGLRPGTEAVPQIVGTATALLWSQAGQAERAAAVALLRDELIALLERLPGVILNGPMSADRVANNVNISWPGFDTEYVAIVLDTAGFAVSTKSACSSSDSAASSVVAHISQDQARAASTLRMTLHEDITSAHLQRLASVLQQHEQTMQSVSKI